MAECHAGFMTCPAKGEAGLDGASCGPALPQMLPAMVVRVRFASLAMALLLNNHHSLETLSALPPSQHQSSSLSQALLRQRLIITMLTFLETSFKMAGTSLQRLLALRRIHHTRV